MDDELQTMKAWAAGRLRHFVSKLEATTNPMDAEAQLYTIMSTANRAFQKFHKSNGEFPWEVRS